MTTANKIAWDDTILPFQLDRSDIRGRVARLDGVLEDILHQHSYPEPVSALVAEAALLTAMIGQSIKLRWKLSLQIRGSGPIRIIATDFYAPEGDGEQARIRAYASFDEDGLTSASGTPFSMIGNGMFAILIDQGNDTAPYQGVTPLAGGSLSTCAETYFDQSEQLKTRFSLKMGQSMEPGGVKAWRAGGIMLQHMPKASPLSAYATPAVTEDTAEENWSRVNLLLDTVEDMEMVGPHVSPTDLLVRLFHEEQPRVFEPKPIRFGCSCGPEKVRQAMSIYSAKDIATMTTEEGIVTADCQFCGAHYEFDPMTLGFEAEG